MAIISFDKDTVVEYVPAYGGNRNSDAPCVVRLKFVPYSRVQHYARLISAKAKGAAINEKVTEIVQEIQKKQFTESVESVSGYFIGDREIANPSEFYETADTDLITELVKAMESQSKLSEGQRKNFERASGGVS